MERIRNTPGIIGYLITNNQGEVQRKAQSMSDEEAAKYGKIVKQIYTRGEHTVRDINPSSSLRYMRLRGKRNEILVAPGQTKCGNKFAVIVIQEWKPAED